MKTPSYWFFLCPDAFLDGFKSGGQACPEWRLGERNSHHGGARYQNRGANDLPFKTTGIHRGVDASCVSNGSIRRLRPTELGRCYLSQRLRLGGGGAFSKPPPSSIRQLYKGVISPLNSKFKFLLLLLFFIDKT